jgi:hypothetical protein
MDFIPNALVQGNLLPQPKTKLRDVGQSWDKIEAILFRFAKAFDKAPHQRLPYNINITGIGTLHSLVGYGVPQGTVMDPLIFLDLVNSFNVWIKI